MVKTNISVRQKEIIEAAGKILISRGIKGLTTKNLANQMGFSESAIYRHFTTKDDIFVTMFNAMLENFQIRLSDIVTSNASAVSKVQSIFESQFAYFSQNPSYTVAVLADEIYFEEDRVKEAFLKIFGYKQMIITAILEQGKFEKSIRTDITTEQLLYVIMGSYRIQMLRWRHANFAFDLQAQGKEALTTLLLLISHNN